MALNKSQILIVCNSFPPAVSGVGQYVYNIVNRLRHKYDFVVLTNDIISKLGSKNVRRIQSYHENLFKVIRVPSLPPYAPYIWTYPLVIKGLKIIRKEQIGLVHVHSFGQIHSDILTFLSKKNDLPVIYSVHGWRNIENLYARPLLGIYESVFAPRILKSADIITVLGKRSLQYIESIVSRSGGCGNCRITIVPNGIDFYAIRKTIKKVRREGLYTKCDRKVILYAGRLSRLKGVLDLIRAFALVHKLHKEAFLTIIGDGPLRNDITTIINKYDLKDSVDIIGYKSHQKVIEDYFSQAFVFVLPSYSEGMPTAILEAMASGVPVITTNVGDIQDIALHKETGLLVKPGDIKQLAESILMVMEDDYLRQKLITNGLRMAEFHDWSLVIPKIDQIYADLLLR